jgi:hypothetical protein
MPALGISLLHNGRSTTRLSAKNGQSGRSSNFQVCLPCFLGSGHWIGGTNFSRLIGSNAAGSDIVDDKGIRFERPVPASTGRRDGYNAK